MTTKCSFLGEIFLQLWIEKASPGGWGDDSLPVNVFLFICFYSCGIQHTCCVMFISDFLVCVSVSQTQLFYRCCCITCMFISEPLLSTSMHVHKDSLSLLISVFCVFVTSTLHLHWAAFVHICTLVAYGRIVLINSDLLVLLIQNRWTHSSSGRGRDEEEM